MDGNYCTPTICELIYKNIVGQSVNHNSATRSQSSYTVRLVTLIEDKRTMSWANTKKRPSSSSSQGRDGRDGTGSSGSGSGGQGREGRSRSPTHSRNGRTNSADEWHRSSSSPRQPLGSGPPVSPLLVRRSPSPNHYYDFDYFMRMSNRIHDDFRDDHDRGKCQHTLPTNTVGGDCPSIQLRYLTDVVYRISCDIFSSADKFTKRLPIY
ncbi:unnamed protein product [Oppiella nova]|uniref:Uncharacterized protein n=1 Tax=Oppiella nova TaxID=334625 RepID=A0A7R9QED9_9ACAR|nr:unnamed protein product [Oppiella nova]CAG2163346.1 unnamed protein product [Oppiella nova]